MSAVLDARAAIWYLLNSTRLSQRVFELIDYSTSSGSPVYISALTLVEVLYLVERPRIRADSFDLYAAELRRNQPAFVAISLDFQVAEAMSVSINNIA